jgi:hypothetical protein
VTLADLYALLAIRFHSVLEIVGWLRRRVGFQNSAMALTSGD